MSLYTTLTGKHVLRFVALTVVAFVSCPYVGYQSLLPILKNEKIFHFLCSNTSKNVCDEQELRLELMFILGMSFLNMSSLFSGLLKDKFGTKFTCAIGSILFSLAQLH